ncbi:uncharacterized protein UV8b_07664 [Ustilaginoidea virens]|uniref:Laccase 1 n=1 Tax=Ustilaginoidea virens TaxID=1159556 RepID=A0A8E5HY33_USTVR|nr:uncharacterized protein UV8b_07664 [Ustilaginoidea virens]QUC23423.1 hypothetical protein UV8b_07664 [Ustilaginoidea virens]
MVASFLLSAVVFSLGSLALPRVAAQESARTFNFIISWKPHAPDGVAREMLLVNDQTPGPVIAVEQDDWVVVNVHNDSPFETSVHFHGIEMGSTPWSDGVPGVTQRAIKPGCRFVYRFQATQYGSYWYHSHFKDQLEDGLYGPIVIHARPGTPKPFSMIRKDEASIEVMEKAERRVQPLMMYDFMHITSERKWNITPQAGVELSCYDSLLFNGKGRVTCLPEREMMSHLGPAQEADLALVPGEKLTDKGCLPAIVMAAFGNSAKDLNESAMPKGIFEGCRETRGSTEVIKARGPWIAIDIIGAVNFVSGIVAIDDHDMWVYAVDGSYIEPQKVQALALSNGDRYSVLVQTRRPGRYPIRLHANSAPQTIVGHAILHVPGVAAAHRKPRQWIDIIGNPLSKDVVFFDEATARPYPPQPIAQKADALHVLSMRLNGASYRWALNSTALTPTTLDHESPPILFDPSLTMAKHDDVTIQTRNGTWVDLVFFSAVYPMPPHPIHKHGVKMFKIGSGTGPFKWGSVEDAAREAPHLFNLVNPPWRDTFVSEPVTDAAKWTVVRYRVTHPGAWLLHCHISNHMVGGMMMVVLDGVDAWPSIPGEYLRY